MPGGLFDLLPHVIVAVEVEHVGDEIECILVVLDLGIQTGEVEPVCEIFFVDFAEIFVSS